MKYIVHEVKEFLCEDCETPLGNHVGWPFVDKGDQKYCHDCALKRNLITADDWLKAHGIGIYDHAIYKNGVITAYQKWGKSFRKDEVRIFEDVGIQ